MSKKIIGITVGTPLPKPNFKQTDPTKGDYIKNKPNPIADEDIDVICGEDLMADFPSNVILKDTITGVIYNIYVEDGKLHMAEVE